MKAKAFFIVFMVVVALSFLHISPGLAQEYPTKPITLIVPFSAGGSTDLVIRKMLELTRFDQPIVIENKPGGAGAVGTTILANAKPDGYTIGTLTHSPLVLVPHLRKLSYDTKKDFEYIMQFMDYMQYFVVRTETPIKSFKEFIEFARKNPTTATYATLGSGSVTHVFMEEVLQAENLKLIHIPFGGGIGAVKAVLGGSAFAALASEAPVHIEAGSLRALAVFKRMEFIPDVPTFKELGYDFNTLMWAGLGGPKGMPKPIIAKLEGAFKEAIHKPQFKEFLKKLRFSFMYRGSEEFSHLVIKDFEYYEALLPKLKGRIQ